MAGALAALMVLAALPRVVGLRAWRLSGDDAWHGLLASLPSLRTMFVEALRQDAHPPLYYLVLRASMACGLSGEPLMLRVPGLVAGVLCVASFYGLGRVATGSRAGGFTLALVAAFSHSLIVLCQPVRHYSLSVLLLSLALLFFLSDWRFKEAGYFVCALLSAQTHHVATLVIGTIMVVGLVARVRERRALLRWCAFHLLVFSLLWLEIRVHPWQAWMNGFLASGMPTSVKGVLAGVLLVVSSGHLGPSSPASWLLLLPFVGGVVVLVRQRRWALVAISLLPLLLASLLGYLRLYPILGPPRIYSWLIPTSVLPIAIAFAALFARWRVRVVFAALTIFAAGQAFAGRGRLWRPDELRIGIDWTRRQPEEEELYALLRARVEANVPVVVSWSEDRNDLLARRLGWTSGAFPLQHVTRSPELPPEAERVDWEIGLDELRGSVKLDSSPSTWVLLGPKPATVLPRIEQRVLADSCLVGARVHSTSRYLLIEVDGEASRRRLTQPDCQ